MINKDHTASSSASISFRQVQSLVQDLKTPNRKIYWADFLASILLGHTLFHVILFADRIWPDQTLIAWTARILLYPLTIIFYMRAAMFIHELVHLPKAGFTRFRIAWNLLCGIFFLIPSFMYYPHVEHHRRSTYGTHDDGEYIALSRGPAWLIAGFLLQSFLLPFAGILRFGLISPIVWVLPTLRPWVHRHLSTMVVDPFYERHDGTPALMRLVMLQEFACFLWCAVLVGRGVIQFGTWNNPLWITAYAVGFGVISLNAFRTLGAHRWASDGSKMDFEEQLLDSVNYPNRAWVTELWGPIGTRFHALHHLIPSLPYHNLGKAHRRLMASLPSDSIYRDTERTSLFAEVIGLWRRARHNARLSN